MCAVQGSVVMQCDVSAPCFSTSVAGSFLAMLLSVDHAAIATHTSGSQRMLPPLPYVPRKAGPL